MGAKLDDVRIYKPFVDGLRAVAILCVVAAHVRLPGFAGGYVGVDIFFVLSGYLIIGQIEADVAAGQFSFIDFAARRALRILPAFLLVMTASLVLVSAVFLQADYDSFSDQFLRTSMMLANHYFLAQQGYFEQWAFTKPLLHMWSLSVEEQFYLIAPFAIVGLHAITRGLSASVAPGVRQLIAAILAIASFVACIALTYGVSHNAAFYAMPTRGWEFILGGNAAALVPTLRRYSGAVVALLVLLGVAAIAFAVVTFDLNTRYPTFRAAYPVIGTTAIIACGIAAPGNLVARALSVPVMVGIGRVSYSWYLWHWPLLSFLRTSEFTEDDLIGALLVAAVALGLATLTYLFVEQPVRAWRLRRKPRGLPVIVSMVSACLLLGIAGFVWTRYEVPQLMPELAGLKPSFEIVSPAAAPIKAATASSQSSASRGWLLGDSQAWNLQSVLENHAARAGVGLNTRFKFGCAPIVGVDMIDRFGDRARLCNELFSNLDLSGAEFTILFARWNFYLGLPQTDPIYPPFDLVSENPGKVTNSLSLMSRGLTNFVAKARQAGARRFLLIGPIPEFPLDPPICVARMLRLGVGSCVIARSAVDARRAGTMAMMREFANKTVNVRVLDPIELFCSATACAPNKGRTLFYYDPAHLSPAGLDRLYERFRTDFEWAFGAPNRVSAQ